MLLGYLVALECFSCMVCQGQFATLGHHYYKLLETVLMSFKSVQMIYYPPTLTLSFTTKHFFPFSSPLRLTVTQTWTEWNSLLVGFGYKLAVVLLQTVPVQNYKNKWFSDHRPIVSLGLCYSQRETFNNWYRQHLRATCSQATIKWQQLVGLLHDETGTSGRAKMSYIRII